MWWLIGGGILAWWLMQCWLDGPTILPWEARNNYKVMNGVLVLLLTLLAIKSSAWHAELTSLFPYCH